jgi:hypothetical protein
LFNGFASGRIKDAFDWFFYNHHISVVTDALLAAALILFGTFGFWLFLTPIGLWAARSSLMPRALSFVAIVVVNYMAMSMLLAMDKRLIGTPEEFLNRPHAWAYFVVVAFGASALVMAMWNRWPRSKGWTLAASVFAAGALLYVHHATPNLQTFPEWGREWASYAAFNSEPTCLIRSAQYIHDHSATAELMQDSQFDPRLRLTAISERQAYVVNADFGGQADLVAQRVAQIKTVQSSHDASALKAWAAANHIDWYLMHPEDNAQWDATFLGQAVYRCEGFGVFRLME